MKRPIFVGFLAAFVVVGFVLGVVFANLRQSVAQPIRFDHKLHVDKANGAGLKCINCHKYFLTQRNSGRPSEETCKACHDNPGRDPEKAKLMAYLDKNQEIPWKRIYHLRDFVRYPHLFHTDKIDCVVCHGPMGDQTSPPSHRLMTQDMNLCINCHKKSGVSVDCLTCHK